MTARILLVEDDPVSRDLLAALLAARGYAVETAEDGFGALRLAQEEPFDLVFVDYHLPEMDGYALARLLRSLGEKTNRDMKMVAITADRFGLAARRGVDTIFDQMLSKPIDPDALYAFVDDALSTFGASEIENFLAEPTAVDAQSAAQVLWRVRGISTLPTAAVFPAPTDAERASLEYCFQIVPPDAADCFVLLCESGLAQIEALRATGEEFLQPLFCLDEKHAALADIVFKVGDGDSWSTAAATLQSFAARRATLDLGIAEVRDIEIRLAAYLHVAKRTLVLRRDAFGKTVVPYTAGFPVASVLETVKHWAASGLLSAKSGEASDGTRELVVSLTAKGTARVAGRDMMRLPSAR